MSLGSVERRARTMAASGMTSMETCEMEESAIVRELLLQP